MGELFPKHKLSADAAGNVMADEGTAGGNSFIIHSLHLVFEIGVSRVHEQLWNLL